MATIKSYTDINQSEKLAEILPLESADMYRVFENNAETRVYYGKIPTAYFVCKPCWSLPALLGVIPNYKLSSEHNHHTCTAETPFGKETVAWFDNPIDVCYEMILKLKEKNLL